MSQQPKRDYDSTVARIAGNVAPALIATTSIELRDEHNRLLLAEMAVCIARAIVAEVRETEPKP